MYVVNGSVILVTPWKQSHWLPGRYIRCLHDSCADTVVCYVERSIKLPETDPYSWFFGVYSILGTIGEISNAQYTEESARSCADAVLIRSGYRLLEPRHMSML